MAATVDAIVAHRPRDVSIHVYAARPNLAALLGCRELVRQRSARSHRRRPYRNHRAAGDRCPGRRLAFPSSCHRFVPSRQTAGKRPVRKLRAGSGAPEPPAARIVDDGAREVHSRGHLASQRSSSGAPASIARCSRRRCDRPPFASAGGYRSRGLPSSMPGALSDDRGAQRLLSMELALHRTRPMHQLDRRRRWPEPQRCAGAMPERGLHGHGSGR